MNKPVLYLRIASVLTFIHAVLHTVGGEDRSWARRHGRRGDESEYVSAYGKRKKLLDVLSGMGLAATVSLTAESILMQASPALLEMRSQ